MNKKFVVASLKVAVLFFSVGIAQAMMTPVALCNAIKVICEIKKYDVNKAASNANNASPKKLSFREYGLENVDTGYFANIGSINAAYKGMTVQQKRNFHFMYLDIAATAVDLAPPQQKVVLEIELNTVFSHLIDPR